MMTVGGEALLERFGIRTEVLKEGINAFARRLLWTHKNTPLVVNPRNLTDRRTRHGLLLEYSLPHVVNNIRGNHQAVYVTSNMFGDFHIQNEDNVVWVEVKTLDIDAEEGASNLDTPLAWIPPYGVLLVMVYQDSEDSEIVYPQIVDMGAFNARTIAKCRNFGWLEPETKQILLDNAAFMHESGAWKKEEGNMGKLLRIAKNASDERIATPYFSNEERVEIRAFRNFIRMFSYRRAEYFADRLEAILESRDCDVVSGHNEELRVRWVLCRRENKAVMIAIGYSDLISSQSPIRRLMRVLQGDAGVWVVVNDKFSYSVYHEGVVTDRDRKINLLPSEELWCFISNLLDAL